MEQKKKEISCCGQLPPLSTKYPWFIAQNLKAKEDDDYIDSQIFYTLHNPKFHYRCQIPELLGRQIRACFYGWMILSNHQMWFLWNPLIPKLIRLPPLTSTLEDKDYGCCLSSPPDDPSSILMLTTYQKPTITFCRLDCKRKKLKWTEMSYAKQLRSITREEQNCFLNNLTCCDGKVYALHTQGVDCDDFVIELQIVVKENEVVISLLPFLKIPGVNLNLFTKCSLGGDYFIKGYGGELFYVQVFYALDTLEILNVDLLRLDMTRMTWEEMDDLEDAVFFVELASDCSIFYCQGTVTKLGGYVHILDETGKILYSYNVKDKTISRSSMPSLVRSNDVSSWAMLECRLEDSHDDSEQKENEKNEEMVDKVVTVDDEYISNSTSGGSHLLNIPLHMLEKIMEFCVGVEYMKFRATCGMCLLASPLIQWSNKTLVRRLQAYTLLSPWLMVLNIHRGTITFTDPLFGDKYYIRIPKEITDYSRIFCSKYGWLAMYKDCNTMAFFNPFTSDIIKLPPVSPLESCCFSAPPTSKNCIVVGFTTNVQCHIHRVAQEPFWRRLDLSFGIDELFSFRFPAFHDQDLYAVFNEKAVVVFRKPVEVDYILEHGIVKPPTRRCGSFAQYLIAKCDQLLFLVVLGKFGESVEVFKLSKSGREWEKTDSLGKHSIYVCVEACLCVEAKIPTMENNIYFPQLHPDNKKIVFYSLRTHRYHTNNDNNVEETLSDLYRTRRQLDPHVWIEPSWS